MTGFIPASLAITSATTPSAQLPEAMGRLTASASAGRLLGPALGGLLAGVLGFRQIFLLVGSLIAVGAVLVIWFLEEPPRAARPERTSPAGNLRFALRHPTLRLALPGLLLAMIGVSLVMPIFPLYVEDLVLESADPRVITGIGFAVVAVFTLIQSTQIGRLTERFGLKIVLVTSLFLAAGALALHPLAASVPAMLVTRALLGIAVAGIAPVLHAMISRAAPEGTRGGITGYASSALILGFFVGPVAGGWLATPLGTGGIFYLAAAVTAGCGIGAWILARRRGRGRGLVPAASEAPR